jgi:hypothetical protein
MANKLEENLKKAQEEIEKASSNFGSRDKIVKDNAVYHELKSLYHQNEAIIEQNAEIIKYLGVLNKK